MNFDLYFYLLQLATYTNNTNSDHEYSIFIHFFFSFLLFSGPWHFGGYTELLLKL